MGYNYNFETGQFDYYPPAVRVTITDAGGYYTGTEVETALQEVGAFMTAENIWDRAGTIVTLHTAGDTARLNTNEKLEFRDTGIYLNSQADGYLDVTVDTSVRFGSTYLGIGMIGATRTEGSSTYPINIAIAGAFEANYGQLRSAALSSGNNAFTAMWYEAQTTINGTGSPTGISGFAQNVTSGGAGLAMVNAVYARSVQAGQTVVGKNVAYYGILDHRDKDGGTGANTTSAIAFEADWQASSAYNATLGTAYNFYGNTPAVHTGTITNAYHAYYEDMTAFSANNQLRVGVSIGAMPDPGAYTGTTSVALDLRGTSRAVRDGIRIAADANCILYSPVDDYLGVTGNFGILDLYKLVVGTGLDGQIYSSSDNLYIDNVTQDKDIICRVNDGGVQTEAMRMVGATHAIKFAGVYTFPVADGNADDVLTTDGAGAVSWQPGGGFAFYDAIVDAAGTGDYTSIATALSTEGVSKSIFVKRGTYAETLDLVLLSGQIVYFDNVSVNMANGKRLTMTGDDTKIEGKLLVTGQGTSPGGNLFSLAGNRNDTFDCDLQFQHTDIGTYAGGVYGITIDGSNHKIRMHIKSITFTGVASLQPVYLIYSDIQQSMCSIVIDGCTNTIASGTSGTTAGIACDSGTDYNSFNVIIQNVITTTGNAGLGFYLVAGANYNSIIGSSRGCDSANLSDGGTGNKTVSLAI